MMRQLRIDVTNLRGLLVAKGLLAPDARDWPAIEFVDERRYKSTPLPAFNWVF